MSVSISPFLWYSAQAEKAAELYARIIPNSRIEKIVAMPVETPSGPPGCVVIVSLTLAGSAVTLMSAGNAEAFNHSISLVVTCDTQAEIDAIWSGLLDGGNEERCGWLKDRFGVSWQIIPRRMPELMSGPDKARAARVAQAMLGMVKIDIATLEAA